MNMGFKLGKNKVKLEQDFLPKDRKSLTALLRKRLAEDKDADLNDIDVSNIDDMSFLFEYLDPHNIDISEWDVSNVENMAYMFDGCENFNCDLSKWDVSNVEDMSFMFSNCKSFEGNGLENWNVKNVTNMHYMFHYCYSIKNKPSWYKLKIKY